jgi:hypothetical protein
VSYLLYTKATFQGLTSLFVILLALSSEYQQLREARRVPAPVTTTKGNQQVVPRPLDRGQRLLERRQNWGYR